MAAIILKILFCVVFALALNQATSYKYAPDATPSINRFTLSLYEVISRNNGNTSVVSSPLSANLILALLSLGAKQQTLNELERALYIPNEKFTRAAYPVTISRLNTQIGVNLTLANKVYVAVEFPLNVRFQKDAVNVFSSEVESIDFNNNVEAANTINGWVEERTRNAIRNLVNPNSLGALTRVVLVNALFFEADWVNQFDSESVTRQIFFRTKKDIVKVDMMTQVNDFSYGAIPTLDATAVELPYVGGNFSMVIILPNKIDGLKALERKLSPRTNLRTLLSKHLNQTFIGLSIPKFITSTAVDLRTILPEVRIRSIFNQTSAQLGGLLKNNAQQVYVSEAVQQVFINVNEKGTFAAAATAVVVTGRTGVTSEIQFVANRPFVYFILSNDGLILFAGNYKGV